VDAVGFLVLSRVFTAHMSGNSAGLGAALGQGEWGEALRRGFPIPVFVLSVVAGGLAIEGCARRGVQRTMSVVLLGELSLLLVAVAGGSPLVRHGVVATARGWPFFALVACLAGAMGLQTAALQRVRGHTVRTTYVTGMLTHLADESVGVWFLLRDQARDGASGTWLARARCHEGFHRARLCAALWLAYAGGAILGSLLDTWINLFALLPAVAVLAAVIATDQVAPLHAGPVATST
jgi:uncharacterized membrane protein YoaK (UPF0700 family)